VRLPWLAHDEAPGPYITIPQYRFKKTKQHDTVDKKRVNSCVLKHLFLERVEQPKILPLNPRNALSDALLMSCFQNFAADAAKKKSFLKPRGFN